ncbi:hypothetical protein P4C99_02910 [Pontiellaceae bacterium B1224]|nr:hypothetical protein [Pontiellaceae bacterium B1224]
MKKLILKISAVAALALLSGCATSFQEGTLNSISEYPVVQHKQSIYVDLAFSGKLNGEPWTKTDKQNQDYLKNRCMQTLEESGMFSFVTDELKSADLHFYVAVINDKESNSSKLTMSALTLFIVPYTTTDTFRTLAVIKEPSSGKQLKFSLSDGVDHRQSLLLAPLAPFKTSGSALEECTDRILENLCMEIYRAGYVK